MASAPEAPQKDATPSMVEKFKAEATARAQELNTEVAPKLAELQEIQDALDSLNQGPRQNGDDESPAPQPRQRRRRSGRTRADDFVRIVSENPGITVSEIAREMKLDKPNYLYRVADQVMKEGRVKKEDKGYVVKA